MSRDPNDDTDSSGAALPSAGSAPRFLRDMRSVEVVDGLAAGMECQVHQLLLDYADSLGAEMSIADVRHEAQNLPGLYAPPGGCFLIARDRRNGTVLGGIGLRPLPGPGDCESKRLHVRQAGRGLGLGQILGGEAIRRARALGYRRMLLEAHESMTSALRIYGELGFLQIPHYYANPVPGTLFLALDLQTGAR